MQYDFVVGKGLSLVVFVGIAFNNFFVFNLADFSRLSTSTCKNVAFGQARFAAQ